MIALVLTLAVFFGVESVRELFQPQTYNPKE